MNFKTINMRNLIFLLFLFLSINAYSKEIDSEKILNEGKLLYRLEKASWYGTDLFLEKFPSKRDSIGGYLSYVSGNKVINIFFSRFDASHIFARFQFDSLPKPNPIEIDTSSSVATAQERDLIQIRLDALDRLTKNEDSFFKFYKNVSFNPIPVITENERKVYIISGTNVNGLVLIGNDYLLNYDDNNNFISKKKIHNSLIQLQSKLDSKNGPIVATMHSHVLSDFIDPTDICTLLLYKDFVDWNQHYVISEKYVSIFDMKKETLTIITRKAWDKINKQKQQN
jgi:hypothetical protein